MRSPWSPTIFCARLALHTTAAGTTAQEALLAMTWPRYLADLYFRLMAKQTLDAATGLVHDVAVDSPDTPELVTRCRRRGRRADLTRDVLTTCLACLCPPRT